MCFAPLIYPQIETAVGDTESGEKFHIIHFKKEAESVSCVRLQRDLVDKSIPFALKPHGNPRCAEHLCIPYRERTVPGAFLSGAAESCYFKVGIGEKVL
jgi:hypothetical protein